MKNLIGLLFIGVLSLIPVGSFADTFAGKGVHGFERRFKEIEPLDLNSPETRVPTVSYNTFRRLTPEHQKEFLIEYQKLLSSIHAQAVAPVAQVETRSPQAALWAVLLLPQAFADLKAGEPAPASPTLNANIPVPAAAAASATALAQGGSPKNITCIYAGTASYGKCTYKTSYKDYSCEKKASTATK